MQPNPAILLNWGLAEWVWIISMTAGMVSTVVTLYIKLIRRADQTDRSVTAHEKILEEMKSDTSKVISALNEHLSRLDRLAEDHSARLTAIEAHAKDDRERQSRMERNLEKMMDKLDRMQESLTATLQTIIK